jgi:flagellar basal body rod protein FlgB
MELSRMRNSVSPVTNYLSCFLPSLRPNPQKRMRQQEGLRMNLTSLITDNITEILVKIIEFTHTRQKILTQNITNVNNPGFVPKELAVNEFSGLLNNAIDEHIRNQRLLLRDTENIKFGVKGSFEVKPVVDEHSKELLEENRDEYLELQITKLLENSLNQRVAAELLRQKQKTVSTDYC